MVKLEEELYKLPPKERIQKIKEIEKQKEKELVDLKKHEEDTERQIKRSIEDAIIEEEDVRKREEDEEIKKKHAEQEIKPLEKTVEEERPPPPETGQPQYKIPGAEPTTSQNALNIYQIAGEETQERLNQLTYSPNWTGQDVDDYNHIKSGLQRVTQYHNISESVKEQLDTTSQILKSMAYKR